MDWSAKETELREAGWSDSDIRGFRTGYESMPTGESLRFSTAPDAGYRQLDPPQMRPHAKGDRGTWQRDTVAGALAAVHAPDDADGDARERAEAKVFLDDHEFVYGRRLTMNEARHAVRRRSQDPAVRRLMSDGVMLGGTAADLKAAFRAAGLRFRIIDEDAPLPGPDAVVHQPVTRA